MPNRLQIIEFLLASSKRVREIAATHPSKISHDLLRLAEDIEADAANLEAELIEARLIRKPPANQN